MGYCVRDLLKSKTSTNTNKIERYEYLLALINCLHLLYIIFNASLFFEIRKHAKRPTKMENNLIRVHIPISIGYLLQEIPMQFL